MLKDEVQVMKGDEVPLIPTNLKTLLMEEHVDTIPWIPYHPTYGFPRKSGRCTPRCQPTSQPWLQAKVSASPM